MEGISVTVKMNLHCHWNETSIVEDLAGVEQLEKLIVVLTLSESKES